MKDLISQVPDNAFRFSTEVDEVHEQLRQKAR